MVSSSKEKGLWKYSSVLSGSEQEEQHFSLEENPWWIAL